MHQPDKLSSFRILIQDNQEIGNESTYIEEGREDFGENEELLVPLLS